MYAVQSVGSIVSGSTVRMEEEEDSSPSQNVPSHARRIILDDKEEEEEEEEEAQGRHLARSSSSSSSTSNSSPRGGEDQSAPRPIPVCLTPKAALQQAFANAPEGVPPELLKLSHKTKQLSLSDAVCANTQYSVR